MCGLAGYSLHPRSSLERTLGAQALLAAIAERGRRRRRVRVPLTGRDLPHRRQAAHACVAAPRARLGARDGGPAPRARPRLHEGSSVDRRQQPPGPPRAGRRHPQRDHHQRRRGARPPLLLPLRAAHDRRLRGDLRGRRPFAERRPRARASARGDGDGLGRRARADAALPRARDGPPDVGRREPRRRLLRLDEARARDRRALLRAASPQARGARGHAAHPGGRPDRAAASASAPTSTTSRITRCRPCVLRRSASSA